MVERTKAIGGAGGTGSPFSQGVGRRVHGPGGGAGGVHLQPNPEGEGPRARPGDRGLRPRSQCAPLDAEPRRLRGYPRPSGLAARSLVSRGKQLRRVVVLTTLLAALRLSAGPAPTPAIRVTLLGTGSPLPVLPLVGPSIRVEARTVRILLDAVRCLSVPRSVTRIAGVG